MSRSPRVKEVEFMGERQLRVTFTDGLVRELDLTPVLVGVFESIDDDVSFAQVAVDSVAGTVCWPGGLDLDPDVLHGDYVPASGARAVVTREYRLQDTPT